VGGWSEKHLVYYRKSANYGRTWSKKAKVICESSLNYIKGIRETYILLKDSDLVQNKSYWKKSMDDSY
jgi:hypothetical protein